MDVNIPIGAISDWLITAGAVTLAISAIWRWWGRPIQMWITTRVDTAEARLVGIERQLVISNGSIKTTEARVNEVAETLVAHQATVNPLLASIEVRVNETVTALEERRTSIDPLITSIAERVVATDAALSAHIIEALPMLRAFNLEHPPASSSTPVIGPPLGSPSLPSQEKE